MGRRAVVVDESPKTADPLPGPTPPATAPAGCQGKACQERPPPVDQGDPVGVRLADDANPLGEDGTIEVVVGPMTLCPVRFHSYVVGQVRVGGCPRPGEDFAATRARLLGAANAMFRDSARLSRLAFVAAFEEQYGPGSFAKSLGGDAVVTSR